MKRRAFSLVEVLIGVMLIAVIAAAFFPSISNGVKMLFDAKKYTEQTFQEQAKVEQGILELNAGKVAGWSDSNVTLFHQSVPLAVHEFSSPGTRTILLALSKERDFSPELPEIKSVTLNTTDHSVFTGRVEYADKKDGKNWEPDVEFCIYRWYVGDLSSLDADFNKDSRTTLSLLKEYNPVREDGNGPLFVKSEHLTYEDSDKELSFGGKTYSIIAGGKSAPVLSIIPNTKSSVTNERTVDQFWKNSLNLKKGDANNFSEEEMKEFYANQGIVFSATPVAKETGLVGEEKFSQMVTLEYGDPSLLNNLTLGIVPIPENVEATHLVEGIVSFSSKSKKVEVKGKKFQVTFISNSTNQEIGTQEVTTDENGYAIFSRTVNTDTSYRIRVDGLENGKPDPDLSVEGSVSFQGFDFKFISPGSTFDEGPVVTLTARLMDKAGGGVKGALVRYQVKDRQGRVLHKSSIRTNSSGDALLRTGQRKKGEYVITATAITPSGQKVTIEHEFTIRSIN